MFAKFIYSFEFSDLATQVNENIWDFSPDGRVGAAHLQVIDINSLARSDNCILFDSIKKLIIFKSKFDFLSIFYYN